MPLFAPLLAWIFGAGVLPWIIRTVMRFLCGALTFAGFKAFVLPSIFSVSFIYGLFHGLPDGVLYFMKVCAFKEGIAIIAACYVAAWVMNRITKACSVFST